MDSRTRRSAASHVRESRLRRPLLPSLLLIGGVGIVLVAGTPGSAAPEDWTQWRGPDRDGVVSTTLPEDWHAEMEPVWRVEVGTGHSSPIVAGDRVWQFARVDGREVLRALELSTGETLWETGHPVPYEMNPAARGHGKGPKSTPVLADGRVFTFGIAGALTAWDADTGEVLWRHDFTDRFERTDATFGHAMSPVVLGDKVIAHVGGPRDGALAAFEVASGRPVWTNEDYGPAYASPVLMQIDGVDHLVTQTERYVLAVDPADGSELWSIPFETPYEQNSVTPLPIGDRLLLSGLDQGLFAVEPILENGTWAPVEVWRTRDASLYMSSPVLANGRVFGMTHRRSGQFFALDPADGEVLWTSVGREGENAAVVVVDDQVLFLTDEAELTVVPVTAEDYRPVAQVEVAPSPTWAHPVPTPSGLLIKDLEHLTLLGY